MLSASEISSAAQKEIYGWLEVDLSAIVHNVRTIRSLIGPAARILAVVKANGYGMGDEEVARAALAGGAWGLGVGEAEEAAALEAKGIPGPFLLLHPCLPQSIPLAVQREYIPMITHPKIAQWLSEEAMHQGKTVNAHLAVNIGMNRLGLKPEEVLENIGELKSRPGLQITGILGHFSSAAESNQSPTQEEFQRFDNLLKNLEKQNITFETRHAANSGAILNHPHLMLDMVRTGILLFGVFPSTQARREQAFLPALALKSRVVHTTAVQRGEFVSYGRRWSAPEAGNLATFPLGYSDGVPSALSNKGYVLIGGKRFPIAGKVCMNLTMCWLGHESADLGGEVVLLGRQGKENITVTDWMTWGSVNPHEALTGFGGKLPKVYRRSTLPSGA